MKRLFLLIGFCLIGAQIASAQLRVGNSSRQTGGSGYLNPKDYIIGGVTISGTKFLDNDVLLTISKLSVGDRIEVPGEATSNAIKNLWSQGLFDNIELTIDQVRGDTVFFNIDVVERPRLTRIDLDGLSKSQTEEVRKRLNENTGKIINENLLNTTRNTIKRYLREKGYLYPDINISQVKDTTEANNQILKVAVKKNKKVKAKEINFTGNKEFSDAKMHKYLKKVKQKRWWRFWGPGKFKIGRASCRERAYM